MVREKNEVEAPPATLTESISLAKGGFTSQQVAGFHAACQWQDILKTGDISRYLFLHFSEFYPTTIVRRSGPVVAIEQAPDPDIGAICLLPSKHQTLNEYLSSPISQARGIIVVHRGKTVFERYPGMRENEYHITMSVAKTMPSLVVGLLEEEGKVNVRHTIGSYVPGLEGTAWNDVKVINVLNMASGLDIEETEQTRDDARSTFGRFLRAVLNVPHPDGKVEMHTDVIRSVRKLREPGKLYEYSSINTQVLVLLAEAIEDRCWAEIFQNRVWSKLNAEGDMQICITPDGIAMPFGFVSMRLRDLARFGMLYTPSWNRAARAPVVSADMIKKMRAGVSTKGKPVSPHVDGSAFSNRHWDWVSHDRGFYKGGLHGQGLYVSPEKDLVIAWFSTAQSTELPKYALAIIDGCKGP